MSKSLFSWSSGKDASFALFVLLEQGIKPDLLLTTVNKDYGRVSMHGLRNELLQLQSKKIGIPLHPVELPAEVSMESYNHIMYEHLTKLRDSGYDTVFFGDIFLEDLKEFRIRQLKKVGMKAEFPVWKRDTREMAMEIIDNEIKPLVVTVSAAKLDESYVGREFDRRFLCDLPSDVDWCGENGEFHTFVYDAPFFDSPIDFAIGEKVYKEYGKCSDKDKKQGVSSDKSGWERAFWYVDVLPAEG